MFETRNTCLPASWFQHVSCMYVRTRYQTFRSDDDDDDDAGNVWKGPYRSRARKRESFKLDSFHQMESPDYEDDGEKVIRCRLLALIIGFFFRDSCIRWVGIETKCRDMGLWWSANGERSGYFAHWTSIFKHSFQVKCIRDRCYVELHLLFFLGNVSVPPLFWNYIRYPKWPCLFFLIYRTV